jgi:hypothetical protein
VRKGQNPNIERPLGKNACRFLYLRWNLTILVLFNPLVPILRRDVWRVIDLAAAGVFVAVAFMMRGTQGAQGSTAAR